ncbi:hypothetical protein ABPG75_010883 [Micractinium tetrahymenae]
MPRLKKDDFVHSVKRTAHAWQLNPRGWPAAEGLPPPVAALLADLQAARLLPPGPELLRHLPEVVRRFNEISWQIATFYCYYVLDCFERGEEPQLSHHVLRCCMYAVTDGSKHPLDVNNPCRDTYLRILQQHMVPPLHHMRA